MKIKILLFILLCPIVLFGQSNINLLLPNSVYVLMPIDSFIARSDLYDSIKYSQSGGHSYAFAQKYGDSYADTLIESTKCSFFFSDGRLTQILVSFKSGTSSVIEKIFTKNVRTKCLESVKNDANCNCIRYSGRKRNMFYGLVLEPFIALTIRHQLHYKLGFPTLIWNNYSTTYLYEPSNRYSAAWSDANSIEGVTHQISAYAAVHQISAYAINKLAISSLVSGKEQLWFRFGRHKRLSFSAQCV